MCPAPAAENATVRDRRYKSRISFIACYSKACSIIFSGRPTTYGDIYRLHSSAWFGRVDPSDRDVGCEQGPNPRAGGNHQKTERTNRRARIRSASRIGDETVPASCDSPGVARNPAATSGICYQTATTDAASSQPNEFASSIGSAACGSRSSRHRLGSLHGRKTFRLDWRLRFFPWCRFPRKIFVRK